MSNKPMSNNDPKPDQGKRRPLDAGIAAEEKEKPQYKLIMKELMDENLFISVANYLRNVMRGGAQPPLHSQVSMFLTLVLITIPVAILSLLLYIPVTLFAYVNRLSFFLMSLYTKVLTFLIYRLSDILTDLYMWGVSQRVLSDVPYSQGGSRYEEVREGLGDIYLLKVKFSWLYDWAVHLSSVAVRLQHSIAIGHVKPVRMCFSRKFLDRVVLDTQENSMRGPEEQQEHLEMLARILIGDASGEEYYQEQDRLSMMREVLKKLKGAGLIDQDPKDGKDE